MISSNIGSEKLAQYNYHRSRLIDLCDKAQASLEQAQNIQKRSTPYGTPADKLRADSYTLVLIGAFQSGKSTLFNYLCDGRELSPVGPNGGGLRTSGCKVIARPIPEGDEERAVITWRKPEELLAALGTTLIKYYEKPSSAAALTAKEVDLDNGEDRDKLASFAIKELTNPGASLSGEERELLRFTLVVCRFYKQFAEKCKAGASTSTPEAAVAFTSYPQDWEKKWVLTKEQDNWKELSEFTEEEVNFAFCGGVELYIDSPVLRSIGCSIIDCPGLFISKWDTEIATQCIKEANAILYMFAGSKSLTAEDVTALKECVRMGGAHKMIFGANIRVALEQWKRILDHGIRPTLQQNGFDNPVVHNFHSAMALRARELMYQECDLLSESSEAAIKYDISLKGKPLSVEQFLRRELNKFISTMTDYDESYEDYEGKYAELEKLSGVPDFVGAASNHVVETRATSVLIYEGTKQLAATLKQAADEMEQKIRLLDSSVEAARSELSSQQSNLQKFKASRELHVSSLHDAWSRAEHAIYETYRGKIDAAVQGKFDELVKITMGLMSMNFVPSWINKNELCQKYAEQVGEVLREVLEDVREDILKNFMTISPVRELRASFEGHRRELMEKLEKFKSIEDVAGIRLQFPEDFSTSVHGMVIPRAQQLMSDVVEEDNSVWEWIWTILSFGLYNLFKDNNARAEAIVRKFIGEFKRKTLDHLRACMEQENPVGPVRVLKKTMETFNEYFCSEEENVRLGLENAEAVLNEELNKAAIIPQLKNQSDEMTRLQSACQYMESDIQKDFPAQHC